MCRLSQFDSLLLDTYVGECHASAVYYTILTHQKYRNFYAVSLDSTNIKDLGVLKKLLYFGNFTIEYFSWSRVWKYWLESLTLLTCMLFCTGASQTRPSNQDGNCVLAGSASKHCRRLWWRLCQSQMRYFQRQELVSPVGMLVPSLRNIDIRPFLSKWLSTQHHLPLDDGRLLCLPKRVTS